MNIIEVRKYFPILEKKSNNKKIVYFDSGTTSLKHQFVIDEVNSFLTKTTSSTFPSDFEWTQIIIQKSQEARDEIAKFMGCSKKEVIFSSGTTLGLITVAEMLKQKLQPGDEIICNTQEHVANQLHWWKIAKETSTHVKMIEMKPAQKLSKVLHKYINKNTKIITFAATTNTTGQKRDIKKIAKICKENNIYSVVDGAQHVASNKLEVSKWDIDFYVWGAHKLFSMPGLGIIYGKESLLEKLNPTFAGGSSTKDYTIDGIIMYKPIPFKFEYGTQNTPAIIATGKVCEWLNGIGMDNVQKHIFDLKKYAETKISKLKKIEIYNKNMKSPNIVMNMIGVSSSDFSNYLAYYGIVVRSGDLCSKLNNFCPSNNSVRLSFSIYNTKEEIDYLISILKKANIHNIVEKLLGGK